MTATATEASPGSQAPATAAAPKRITNAQTVCNEKNAKGKLCNGHLKQLNTAGEAAVVHLRGDDVLSKCNICGTLYMGPPLGHVRDPQKQSRFVENELSALLQAAGGTMPVIKKDERGVFVMETPTPHSTAKPAPTPAATPAAAAKAAPTAAAKPATAPAAKAAAPKAGADPDRTLMKRYTYAGVVDAGPQPGETFEQKVARLKAVAAAAKQRSEEGGGPAGSAVAPDAPGDAPVVATVLEAAMTPPDPDSGSVVSAPAAAPSAPAATEHKPTGEADRSLMLRATYCGVVDTGPVPGETFAQKVERLRAVAAAAKQRSEGG